MGTRNSTLVQVDGEYKLAQYCQWDGYPEGRGVAILEVLRKVDLNALKVRVRGLRAYTTKGVKGLWTKSGADPKSPWVGAEAFKRSYPHLSRDCGGDAILKLLMEPKSKIKKVKLDLDFPGEGLFCEWAYVIDLDRNTFEVYKGFGTELLPDDARFKHLEKTDAEYKPVRIAAAWSLDELPTNEEFLAQFSEAEEE